MSASSDRLFSNRKRRDQGLKQNAPPREVLPTVLIFCEGATEVGYINSLCKDNSQLTVHAYSLKGKVDSVLEIIQKKIDDYFRDTELLEVHVVFDRDDHCSFNKIINALSAFRYEEKGLTIYVSYPCFEHWVLQHYEDSNPVFTKCKDLVKVIKKIPELKNYVKGEKKINLYEILKDKTDTAIKRSKIGDRIAKKEEAVFNATPSMNQFYKLVDRLLKLN